MYRKGNRVACSQEFQQSILYSSTKSDPSCTQHIHQPLARLTEARAAYSPLLAHKPP